MLGTATIFDGSRAAEDVVHDTWLAAIRGMDRFGGRSTLKTWIFHIQMRRAKTQALLDRRVRPFSALTQAEAEEEP